MPAQPPLDDGERQQDDVEREGRREARRELPEDAEAREDVTDACQAQRETTVPAVSEGKKEGWMVDADGGSRLSEKERRSDAPWAGVV